VSASPFPLIDVHTHVVPKKFPQNPSPSTNSRWPCLCAGANQRATISFGDKPFRELDSRSWDLAARIESMDQERITAQVLSPMPELLSYWFNHYDALAVTHHVNGVLAEMVANGDGRFYGLGMVPLQDPALAARELSRLKADGLVGVELGSNINGALLGEARFLEFFAEAERLNLAIFVHALHPVGTERLSEFPDLIPYAAFPLDTGLSAISLIRAGIPARFPKLRIGFSHGGGAIVPLVHRLDQGWRLSEGFGGALPQSPHYYAARFFYDSLVYDAAYLKHLTDVFAPGQIFAGTDYPYVIEQRELATFLHASETPRMEALFTTAAQRFLGSALSPPEMRTP
jgi:aminocarboxymuconate-semialdehyde decarboxylase